MTDAKLQNTNPSTISIILPTRGRTGGALQASLKSLMENAEDPSRVEIMLGVDDDDQESLDWVNNEASEFVKPYGCSCKAKVFKPLGYTKLNVYVNLLCHASSGAWLFLWNDDALMQTKGWDTVVRSYDGDFKCLAPKDNHDHPFAIFPLIPADWFVLCDAWSINAQNDTWVSVIARMNGIFERIDIEILHDRADMTGGNDDETFANRQYMEGNPNNPEDFNHPNMQQARMHHASKIDWFLKKMKVTESPSYFEKFINGEENPFADIGQHNPKGAGQFDSINKKGPDSTKDRLPDDTKIEL
jgi:hypothetical protein